METRDILKKVRQIEIKTRGVVNEVLSGEYHAVFKGRGMDFAEVREYQMGDDVRLIDWNVSARLGHPFIKVFEEERELLVMLLCDVSSSAHFGSVRQMPPGRCCAAIAVWQMPPVPAKRLPQECSCRMVSAVYRYSG